MLADALNVFSRIGAQWQLKRSRWITALTFMLLDTELNNTSNVVQVNQSSTVDVIVENVKF